MTIESVTRKAGEGIPVALQARIVRGIALAAERGEEIEWVDHDRCWVPSRSMPGQRHLVVLDADGEKCSCKDFGYAQMGACLHTVAVLISWAKRVEYRVVNRHDSRIGGSVWDVVETRAGQDVPVGTFTDVGDAYSVCWELRGWTGEEA